MIDVEAISKRFGTHQLLRNVSFTARNGNITTLLGANGAGKTTALRIITGLMHASGGHVTVDGLEVGTMTREARARMGVLPDRFGLYPNLTAREHLQFFGRLRGSRGRDLAKHVDEAETLLGIAAFSHVLGRHLSQGQSMRVAVGRAVLTRPANIVMDEPTRGLDVHGIRMLRDLLRNLRDLGHAVLLTNHSLAEVETLSDRVVVLANGCIAGDGAVSDLLERTQTRSLEAAFLSLAGAAP